MNRQRILAYVVLPVALLAPVRTALADRAAEIARIHIAAIGGHDRIAALTAYRASGHLMDNGQSIGLVVLAARPGKLRVELRYDGRTIVQATDGQSSPWRTDSGIAPTRSTLMNPATASDFITEAEFDDPLVAANDYGCEIDYGGEVQVGGRRLLRLLLTQRLTKTFYLLIDPSTFFIVGRIDRSSSGAQEIQVLTEYSDFRPVAGVLLPHTISVSINGRPVRKAVFDVIEPTSSVTAGLFTRPSDQ